MDKGTILIVDDDPAVLKGLYRILSRQEYTVEGASTAEAALDVLRRQRFDLVITDLQMPGMDGLTLLSEIKKRSKHTPVVMLTGHGSMETAVAALRRGVSDFITKPYQPDELLNIVQREVTRYRQSMPPGMEASLGLQLTEEQADEIDILLASLRAEVNARCVLLIEGNGSVLSVKGVIEDMNISALGALVAGDFAATASIASLIGEEDAFKLNFHEGAQYSIYSGQVVSGIYLLIVFSPDVRLGAVLYYTKDTLAKLKLIVEKAVIRPAAPLPLLQQSITTSASPVAAEKSEAITQVSQLPATPVTDVPESEVFSFDEILNSGLLDENLLSALESQFNNVWAADTDNE
ncbi:MAG: sigma-54-dependent Fis family transcriptional regulator [Anaerolineae bacterium]|nr:sigma-54-dependent Fis family transcriptional regulator [Anaerolineae bacterium]